MYSKIERKMFYRVKKMQDPPLMMSNTKISSDSDNRDYNRNSTRGSSLRYRNMNSSNCCNSIVEMDVMLSDRLNNPRTSLYPCPENSDNFYRQNRVLLCFMRLLGFFPFFPTVEFKMTSQTRVKGFMRRIKEYVVMIWSISCLLINLCLFIFNVYTLKAMGESMGLLHPDVMATLLTSLKPMHNVFNLLVFIFCRKNHLLFLRFMKIVDSDFFHGFGVHPRWTRGQIIIFCLAFVTGSLPFCARLFEYILLRPIIGPNWFADTSLVLVPLLSLWQLVPLYYFVYINNIMRFWFRHLKTKIASDPGLISNDSEFYYQHYLQLTKCVASVGDFMNPFLFFSMATSVVVMCLTIYFLINAETVISIDPNATAVAVIIAHTFPAWAVLQICVSFAYVLWIAVAGIKTNEEARFILTAVLSLNCFDEKTRFNVTRFIARIQSQYSWGISIWKTLPVERGLLFTLFGLISTYAVLLLKLQQDQTGILGKPGFECRANSNLTQ